MLNSVAKQCLQANALQTAPKPRLETWEFQKLLFFKINKIPWQRGFVSSNSTPFSYSFKGKLLALKEAVSNIRKLQDYMSCNLNLIFIFVWPKWHVCFLRNIKLYRIIELHSKSCYSVCLHELAFLRNRIYKLPVLVFRHGLADGRVYKPVNSNDRKFRELIHTQIAYVTLHFHFQLLLLYPKVKKLIAWCFQKTKWIR